MDTTTKAVDDCAGAWPQAITGFVGSSEHFRI